MPNTTKPNAIGDLPLRLHIQGSREQIQSARIGHSPRFELQVDGMERTAWLRWLESYSEGKPLPLPFPLSFQGLSPFTRVVLAELQNIPFGKSMSYKALAESVGSPKAYRAAGSACGRNPFPLIVPCHRILAHSQKIGGFSLDLSLKCLLLDFEKISYHL